jgi:hypothetical protein
MQRARDLLLTDIRALVADLGAAGGLMGPSIYDTAQVLRLAPPAEGVWPALEWLVAQQGADGGWGNPSVPRARDVPTLAALLAIHAHDRRRSFGAVLTRGLAFLRRQSEHWTAPLPDDLPVGVELLFPRLLEEAAAAGMEISTAQYSALLALGHKRRRLIAGLTLRPGTTPVHSWEALQAAAERGVIDETGGVGHSPAATAAWLRASQGRAELADLRDAAERFLHDAAHATGANIPGVVPTAWPITRFEQAFGLYALLLGGVLRHPALEDVAAAQLRDVADAITPAGIGFSDHFVGDGDDTAALVAVMRAWGMPVNERILTQYAHQDHYCTYPGELQPSLTATAHAVHALLLLDLPCDEPQRFLVRRQLLDGRWHGEKWNGAWLYPTSRTLVALRDTAHIDAVRRGISAVVAFQRADGGWGMLEPNIEETAYAVLALHGTQGHPGCGDDARRALARGQEWLLHNYRPLAANPRTFWLAKENYRPERLARLIEAVATLTAVLPAREARPEAMEQYS